MAALRVVRAAQLQDLPADQPNWLIEPLWGNSAVGLIGGAPKSGKTFLALELAVAVGKHSVYRCGAAGHTRIGVLRDEVWEDSGGVRKAARGRAGAR